MYLLGKRFLLHYTRPLVFTSGGAEADRRTAVTPATPEAQDRGCAARFQLQFP